ncbi:MAG: ADP-ribosylglycohydrolase family protein [Phycisphaerales bacterium]
MRLCCVVLLLFVALNSLASGADSVQAYRTLNAEVYKDKMMGGWLGQMAGVSLGAPTEVKACGVLFPENEIPKWTPDVINGSFEQDDLYVEMTFLRTLEVYGPGVLQQQAAIDFANSKYILYGANFEGRHNLRKGIAPPDCAHPKFNKKNGDLDYQIEADFSGLIAPGMPQYPIEAGEKFGRFVCYGDGVYGGQFVGAMYSEAFFETNIEKIIRTALKSIPSESRYARCINDILMWYKENPDDWKKTWKLLTDKYYLGAGHKAPDWDISAVLNGGYVCIGLLYGQSDPDKTISIAIQCGQDSDCNPSSACGVIFTVLGNNAIPAEYKTGMDQTKIFSFTNYTYPQLVDVSDKLARQIITRGGGEIKKMPDGSELFYIPNLEVKPSKLECSANPGPIVNSVFTEEEISKITEHEPELGKKIGDENEITKLIPGWEIENARKGGSNFYESYGAHKTCLETIPPDMGRAILSSQIMVGPGKTHVHVAVCHYFMGDFMLLVRANGKELLRQFVTKDVTKDYLFETDVDLSDFANQKVKLELINQANGLGYKQAYWLGDKIKIIME